MKNYYQLTVIVDTLLREIKTSFLVGNEIGRKTYFFAIAAV